MFEADDTTVFVSFDTLLTRVKPFRFFNGEVVLERFYLSGLQSRVIRYDSTFNFDDLITFHESELDTIPEDTISGDPFKFQFSNIEFSHARFVFENHPIGDTMVLRDLSFFIPYIGWNQEERSEADLRFAFRDGGYFESSINADPSGGDFDAEILINTLSIDGYTEYLSEFADINTIHGLFNSQLFIKGNINQPERSILSGNINLSDFRMTDKRDKEFMGAEKIDVTLKTIDAHRSRFVIDSLMLTKPYIYFELDTGTNNFVDIFNISSEDNDSARMGVTKQDTTLSASVDSIYYTINHLAISKGILDYRDMLTGEPFDYYLSDIEMNADSILSTSDWVTTYSTMILNKRGKLVAEVGFNPANPFDLKLDYVISDFQLSDLNIYSRFYVGFPILNGDMYYKGHSENISNQLKSDNKLIIQNAELGDKSGGLFDLPMKFALFILKDRNGVINLDIPVRGNLNDPRISVGKIVWNTLKNLIVKIATSPFDLLASQLSVDPKDIRSIEYTYLDTVFTAARQKQIDLLLELEKLKEGLEIELVYFNDIEKEKEQIAVDEAGKLFNNSTGNDYRIDKEDFVEFLKSKIATDSIDIIESSKKIVQASRIDSLAEMYALSRRTSLEKYLQGANDSTKIKFSVPAAQSPKNVGSQPKFEVKYSIKQEELEKR